MINKEEIEAIEIVNGIHEDDLLNYWEGPEEPYNAIQVVLNLIAKQENRIKELEADKETLTKERNYYKERYNEFNEAFIKGGKKLTRE